MSKLEFGKPVPKVHPELAMLGPGKLYRETAKQKRRDLNEEKRRIWPHTELFSDNELALLRNDFVKEKEKMLRQFKEASDKNGSGRNYRILNSLIPDRFADVAANALEELTPMITAGRLSINKKEALDTWHLLRQAKSEKEFRRLLRMIVKQRFC